MNGYPGQNAGTNGVFNFLNRVKGLSIEEVEGSEGMTDSEKGLHSVVEWLNEMLPYLNLPLEASHEELRACLMDGTVFCNLLNQLTAGSIGMGGSFEPARVKVVQFLTAMDEMALPRFEVSDLEQGDMVPVLQSLKALKASFSNSEFDMNSIYLGRRWSMPEVDTSVRIDQSNEIDTNYDGVFQLKEGSNTSISDAKILELMKSSGLQTTSTQLLFSMLNKVLDESAERMKGNVCHGIASLLRTIVQEIEHRISTQAVNLKNQNILFRVREEKYQSRIKVLEALAAGTREEKEIATNQMEQIKLEKAKVEEKGKLEEQNLLRLKKEKDHSDSENSKLKQELDVAKKTHEKHCLELEARAEKNEGEYEKKLREAELRLADSRKKVKEFEKFCKSKSQKWEKKECTYQSFIDKNSEALQELKVTSELIKHEVIKTQKSYSQDLKSFGLKLRGVVDAAQNYHVVLEENRKLYNEVQDLKGNIRVYCRIRPFLPGQNKKQTTIEYIGENGELVVSNPSKQGKDTHRLFKFNKVFGPAATQEEVFLDTQPLVRSILDGYNVCIFAYGQTGSGKTYTMSGPSISSKEDWGVNYRALNDLFQISQSRQNSIQYDVGVQMVEIYNEQVRDLLSNSGSQRRFGIWNTTQPNGLAVPDASMHCVKSTDDVVELMNIGLMNRAVGATALNERSSRSHSVLTVHVRGMDLDTHSELRGSLHLIDLAGSERVDRSEATGDRLKEAQHINKSLSALGDVIFALAQKSVHVPYRNSKLTQVLQSYLGGQAKTLMFVQINPDIDSYSETVSTLKFAERVSGVELGAARSNKESRDVRQLMEQVSSLKVVIAKKDEEIERFQQLKGNASILKRSLSLRYGSLSPRRHSLGSSRQGRSISRGKGSGVFGRATSDADTCSEHSDRHSEAASENSLDEFTCHKKLLRHAKLAREVDGGNLTENVELIGLEDADSEERLSDISDGCLSMGTETDGSLSSVVELTLFPDTMKAAEYSDKSEKTDNGEKSKKAEYTEKVVKAEKAKRVEKVEKTQRTEKSEGAERAQRAEKSKRSDKTGKEEKAEHNEKANLPSKLTKPTLKPVQTRPSRLSMTTTTSTKTLSSAKKPTVGSSSSIKPHYRGL